jgi:hypothetical protein
MCIVGKNKYYLHLLRSRLQSKARQNLAFLPVSKAHTSQLYIFRQYVYASVKKRTEIDVILIKAVPYNIHTYTVTASYCSIDMNQAPEKLYLVYD